MFLARLKIVADSGLTASNLLDRMASHAAGREVFRTDESLEHYGVHGRSLTVGEVRSTTNRMSNALAAVGVRRHDRVAVWKANSLDYFLLSMAAIRLGAIAVPVNGGMAPDDLAHYVRKTGARALCLDRAALERLVAAGCEPTAVAPLLLVTDAVGGAPKGTHDFARSVRAASDEGNGADISHDAHVLICHTSGTTGFPKGVLHCSESLTRAVRGQLRIQPVTHRNVAMMAVPMNHHIAVSGCMTNVAAGLPVYIATDTRPEVVLRRIEDDRVSIFFAFPHTYLDMYRHGIGRYNLGSVRMWMSGADAMHEVHIREFTRHGAFTRIAGRPVVGSLFMELLGTSEVGIVALMKVSTPKTQLFARCVGRRTPISPKVKIADEAGQPLPPGEVGRLMVKGPTVFKGYWNEHDRLHGAIIDGWWWTGDIGYRDRRGRFYHLDREVDRIRTSAGPIYTLLAEEELLKHPDVHEAVVVGVPSQSGNEEPLVLLQAKEGSAFDEQAARRWVAERLPLPCPYTNVVVVRKDEDVPRGLTGKVLKRVVRERYGSPQAASQSDLCVGEVKA